MMAIPKLRFPEFTDEWQVKKLGDVTTKVGSGSTPRGGSAVYKQSGIPFVRSQNVSGGQLNLSDVVYIDQSTHDQMKNSHIKPNDVLLNITGASLGRSCVVPSDFSSGNLSQHVCIIRLNGVSPYFVHTILSKAKSLDELLKSQTGGGKEGLNFQAVRSFKLAIPSKPEQEKIADFLTDVDKKIESIDRRVELLKQYKRGVMQQIFSQQVRIKDNNGNDYPDWEEKKLGEIGTFKSGVGFPDSEQGGKAGVPFFKVSDMNLEGNDSIMKKANNYVNDSQIHKNRYKPITERSIIFAKVGAAIFLERKRVAENFLIDNNMMSFTPKSSHNFEYIRICFERLRLSSMAQVGALPSYNGSDLAILKIGIPNADAQQKIADFFTAIDEKITAEQIKLTAARQFKKFLLQRMFV